MANEPGFKRFQRLPSSREASIWDVYSGVYPENVTAWAAPTYQWWYPHPFGQDGGASPMEKLQNPEGVARAAQTPQPPRASAQMTGESPAVSGDGQTFPLPNSGGALGLLASVGLGQGVTAGIEKGVEGVTSLMGKESTPATAPKSEGATPSPGNLLSPVASQVSQIPSTPTPSPGTPALSQSLELGAGGVTSPGPIVASAPSPTAVDIYSQLGFGPAGEAAMHEKLIQEGIAASAKAGTGGTLTGTTGTEFLNAAPSTSEKALEILNSGVVPGAQTALGAYDLATGIDQGNVGSITSGTASTAAGTAALAGAIPASAAATIGAAFAFPALMAALDESDWFGLGGRSDMIRRQMREEELRQHAQADVASGFSNALTPGAGLDIAGIDIDRDKLAELPTETLLASLARSNALRGSANFSTNRAGDLPPDVDQMNAEITRRQIDIYDELQRRGVTAPADVTGWGGTERTAGPDTPYSARDWTLAQYLSILGLPDATASAEDALGYAVESPLQGPLGPWFDAAVAKLRKGERRHIRTSAPPENPY